MSEYEPGHEFDDSDDELPKGQPTVDPKHVAVVLAHIFDQFCVANNVVERRRASVNPQFFVNWMGAQTFDVATLATVLNVDPAAVEHVLALSTDPLGPARLLGTWPYVCLAHRDEPKNPLQRFHYILMLTWKDGLVAPMVIQGDQATVQTKLTDAVVASEVTRRTSLLTEGLFNQGLDFIHDLYAARTRKWGRYDLIGKMSNMIARSPLEPEEKKDAMALMEFIKTLFVPARPEPSQHKPVSPIITPAGSGPAGGFDS